MFTARPRIGYAINNFMLYATGGLAVADVKYSHSYTSIAASTSSEAASISKTKLGWTIGGGFEYAFNRNWTLNAEYLYVDLGNIGSTRARVQNNVAGPLRNVFDHDVDLTANTVRVGINYKF